MGNKNKPWPTHGKAVDARNEVAEAQFKILRELEAHQRLIERDEATRLDQAITVNRIHELASRSLMILIEQGAPYLPIVSWPSSER